MKILQHSKIQKQLFIFYSLLMLSVLIVLSVWLSVNFSSLTQNYTNEVTSQISKNASDKINALVQQMDTIAKQVVFSNVINSNLFNETIEQQKSIMLPLVNRRAITNEMYSMLGPNFSSVKQINLINCSSGNYLSAGIYPLETLVAISEINESDWMNKTISAQGKMCLIGPHTDAWSGNSGHIVFSVTRSFRSSLDSSNIGVVEIPGDINQIGDIIDGIQTSNGYISKMFVYTPDHVLVYGNQGEAEQYWDQMGQNKLGSQNSFKSDGSSVSYNVSSETGWTVLVVADESMMTTPISTIYTYTLIIFGFAMVGSLLLSYYLSNKFTKPIAEIYTSISNVKFVQGQIDVEKKDDMKKNELEQLAQFFESLCQKLDIAINEAALAHSCETEARIMALEAQINPHFLYNTFALIQTYAEEGRATEIGSICEDLAYLLRYAVSEDNAQSTVSTELKACATYLGLMHRRNFNRLSYTIDADGQILSELMPRMILQPIVENSFKHGLMMQENWIIGIKGYHDAESWKIEISDNGCGVDESIINKIYEGVAKADFGNYSMAENHKSIGLLNIGVRLKLSFGDKMIFAIENQEDGGAKITIGKKRVIDHE